MDNGTNGIRTLSLFPIDYPFETLVSRIETTPAKLILNPEFQRKYKWDQDGWGRASKFIESCLMRIPLPSCYFAEDENGNHYVIDGVQRLSTIKRFFNNEFALEGMTVYAELEGKKFSEIGDLQAELETTTIRCIVLRKENPRQLVREIFSRLNQGSVILSDQEIRHALFPGSLDSCLSELAKHSVIERFGLGADSERVKNSREDEEQILRFFAFTNDLSLNHYDGNLRQYLDDYMEVNLEQDQSWISEKIALFNKAMENCITVFSDDVFTNPAATRRRQGLVHYDLLMPTLGLLDSSLVTQHKDAIKRAYLELCEMDEFRRSVSGGLQNKGSIIRRRTLWSELLEGIIG